MAAAALFTGVPGRRKKDARALPYPFAGCPRALVVV